MAFLKLLQDRYILPELIQPADLEEVFRRVHLGKGDCSGSIEPLSYPQFTDVVCLTAMALYDQKKFKGQYHTLESKLEAFFCMICGIPLPRPAPISADAQHLIYGSVPADPFKCWWDLAAQFTEEDQAGAVDFMSSRQYRSVLIQEVILPPEPCPSSVIPILDRAAKLHNNGSYDLALETYACAQQQWEDAHVAAGSFTDLGLLTNPRLYFLLAAGSVHMSAGRYDEALEQYDAARAEAERLPEGHANEALLCSTTACAYHALGKLQLAFEHLVRGMVLRSRSPLMGPRHVDSQLTCHNLGCVLDRLGCSSRALELLEGAHTIFQQSLGNQHPRTQLACRNMQHVRHRCLELEMHYTIRADKPKLPVKTDAAQGKGISKRRKQAAAAHQAAKAAGAVAALARPGSAEGLPHLGRDAAAPARGRNPHMSLQQRLAAFRERRVGSSSAELTRPRVTGPCDLMYLGAGMQAASAEALCLYECVKKDIAMHASGAVVSGITPEAAQLLEEHSSAAALAPEPSLTSIEASRSALPRLTMRGGVADATLAARKTNKRTLHSQFARPTDVRLPPVPKESVHERLLGGVMMTRKKRGQKITYVDKLADFLSPKQAAAKAELW